MSNEDDVKDIGNDLISDFLMGGIEYLTVTEQLWDMGLTISEDDQDKLAMKIYQYVNSTLDTLAQRFEDDDS